MRALLLTFTLILLPGALRCVPARLLSSSPQHGFSAASRFTRRPSGEPAAHLGSSELVKKIEVHLDSLAILPLRTRTSYFVSIFDWRLKQFLCMDLRGEMYRSREQSSEDCVFQHIWSDQKKKLHRVFYSTSSGRLLRLQATEGHRPEGQESPDGLQGSPHDDTLLPSALLARLLLLRGPLAAGRQRRSHSPVNPSDPLRSEPPHPPGGAGGGLHPGPPPPPPEQEQPGAVSKETINSCDDPLKVLQQPSPPVSPVKHNLNNNMHADEASP